MSSEILNNGVFCVMPWTHFAVGTDGRVRPCSWETERLQIDNQIYNVVDHDISKHESQPPIAQLKQNMLEGKKSDYCKRCYEQETLCGVSKRTMETFNFQKDAAQKIANNEVVKINEIELRLGNMCNIGCISCGPGSSSFFVKEIDKKNFDRENFTKSFNRQYDYVKSQQNLDWYKNQEFWTNIEKHLENVTYIYLAGGEPTIIKENWEFLEKVIELGYAKNIKLGISTNLTNVQPRHIEIYSSFKETRIYSSIDGYGDLNDYVRYPSKWSAISKNFKTLCKETDKNIVKFNVIPVISIFTIWKLDTLVEWIRSVEKETGANIDFGTHTLLRDPAYMSLLNMPDDAKYKALEVVERFADYFVENDFQVNRLRDYIKNSIGNGNTNNFYQGKKYTENFDKLRNNSWQDYVPELKTWWR